MTRPSQFRIDQSTTTQSLLKQAEAQRLANMRRLFADDNERFSRFSRSSNGILLDFSKQRLDTAVLDGLLSLTEESGLASGIEQMLGGQAINFTENRAVLHCAARQFERTPAWARAEISETRKRLDLFAEKIHSGAHRGSTGAQIRHVVHIGIGGSDLGPRVLTEALTPFYPEKLRLSYAANIDETEIGLVLRDAVPGETLFIVASKSFSTAETLANARFSRQWLESALGACVDLGAHFVAISNNVAAAEGFGIKTENIFPMPEWVGGRFSVWSAIGLPVILAFGSEVFDEFLAGGRSMDTHFSDAPFTENLPVLLALIGIWNASFLGLGGLAVLPYSHPLRKLPAYLQQLEMESNGKHVDRHGLVVELPTAPILFGGPGTVGQHAYHQLFYQGNRSVALDFVVPIEKKATTAGRSLIGNALAQASALMLGRTLAEASAELTAKGLSPTEVERLAPHLVCAGNQPSNTLVLPALSPFTLGQLLALYEHKVFVQGWIWGINSFDQYGVELGKNMARRLEAGGGEAGDASTRGLLAEIESRWARL